MSTSLPEIRIVDNGQLKFPALFPPAHCSCGRSECPGNCGRCGFHDTARPCACDDRALLASKPTPEADAVTALRTAAARLRQEAERLDRAADELTPTPRPVPQVIADIDRAHRLIVEASVLAREAGIADVDEYAALQHGEPTFTMPVKRLERLVEDLRAKALEALAN